MRSVLMPIIVTATLACPCLHPADLSVIVQSERSADDITFYRVPLMCGAARGSGCGTRAKPVLLDLQRNAAVNEAWLHQTGEILAVVWTPGGDSAARQSVIAAATEAHGVSIDPVTGDAQEAALKGFRSGTGWHRGADVDRLSEQEARVIADRLLRRVAAKAPTSLNKISAVEPVLTEAIRRQLVGTRTSPTQCRDALLTAARTHFSSKERAALGEAIERGFQPVGDER